MELGLCVGRRQAAAANRYAAGTQQAQGSRRRQTGAQQVRSTWRQQVRSRYAAGAGAGRVAGAPCRAVAKAARAALPPLPLGVRPLLLICRHAAGGAGVIEVALRLLGGGRASRRFSSGTDTVGHLAAFAAEQGADVAGCQLAAQFPRRVFADWDQSLAAAGVGNKELVTLERRQ